MPSTMAWTRIKERVKDSRIFRFFDFNEHFRLDLGLISQFLNSFDESKSLFFIFDKKLCLGLEDVLYLTGLPIIGKAIICDGTETNDKFEDLVGIPKPRNKKYIDLRSLKN